MAHTANASGSQRLVALAMVVVLHGVAFGLLLAQRGSPERPAPPASALTVVAVALPAKAAEPPPPPALPSKVIEPAKPEPPLAFSPTPDATGLEAPVGGCPTLELVRNAILADPRAVYSVWNAPPQTRSIAEAVVLWNVGWSESAFAAAAPLGPVRAAVERGLETVQPQCLDEPIIGPRLVPISAGDGTMFVVFGSGQWTWRALAENRGSAMLPINGASERGSSTPKADRN